MNHARTALSVLGLTALASAQSAHVVLKQGDVLPGFGTVLNASAINVAITDDGTWMTVATYNGSGGAVALRGNIVEYGTGQLLSEPAGLPITGVSYCDLDSRGELVAQLAYVQASVPNEGLYRDGNQFLRRGIAPFASGWAAGATYADFNSLQLTRTGRLLTSGECSEPGVSGTLSYLSVIQLDAANEVATETLIARDGAQLAGQPWVVMDVPAGLTRHSINASGNALYSVRSPNVGASSRGAVMSWNGTTSSVLYETAQASPIAGATWLALENSSVALADSGQWAMVASLTPPAGQTSPTSALLRNGAVVAAQGDALSLSGTLNERLSSISLGIDAIADNGDVAWIARTNGVNTNGALMLNDQVLVKQQSTSIDGVTLYSIDATNILSISPNGRFVIFTARITPTEDCVVIVDRTGGTASLCAGDGTGAACPCANSGSAAKGCSNSFDPTGAALATSGTTSLTGVGPTLLASGMPNGAALFYQGTQRVNAGAGAAFGDGLRCVGGTIVRFGVKFVTGGTAQYPVAGDPSIASFDPTLLPGSVRYAQAWYRDGAPFCTASTYNLTNAVALSWSP